MPLAWSRLFKIPGYQSHLWQPGRG